MTTNNFRGNRLTRHLFGIENASAIATRTVDGQSWYMAADICGLVGISNHSQAVHGERTRDHLALSSDEWRKETIYLGGYGKKHVLMVNNAGMLKLICQASSDYGREVQDRAYNIPEDLFPSEWGQYFTYEQE